MLMFATGIPVRRYLVGSCLFCLAVPAFVMGPTVVASGEEPLVDARFRDDGSRGSETETPVESGIAISSPAANGGSKTHTAVTSDDAADVESPQAAHSSAGDSAGDFAGDTASSGETSRRRVSVSGETEVEEPPAHPVSEVRLTPEVLTLRPRLERCLALYRQQRLNTGEHSCWSVMHAFLATGADTEIHVGGPKGPRVNAIGWMCFNRPCAGRQLFYLSNGVIRGREGPGYQGHAGQFLAMLAQCRVRSESPIQVDGQEFTVEDLIAAEQRTCRENMELTFKLIGLVHYLDSDEEWKNQWGDTWNIPRIIRSELSQPINGAACGGTHRIMGLSYAVLKRRQRGEPVTGQWWRAEKYVSDYHRYALSLQNSDGSFSADWFRGRNASGDINRQIQTTGHILEWLVYTLPDSALTDHRVVHSVRFLTNLMIDNRYREWETGPKCHAMRALAVYHERVFDHPLSEPLADHGTPSVR